MDRISVDITMSSSWWRARAWPRGDRTVRSTSRRKELHRTFVRYIHIVVDWSRRYRPRKAVPAAAAAAPSTPPAPQGPNPSASHARRRSPSRPGSLNPVPCLGYWCLSRKSDPPVMASDKQLRDWVSDKLMSVHGFSTSVLVHYVIGLGTTDFTLLSHGVPSVSSSLILILIWACVFAQPRTALPLAISWGSSWSTGSPRRPRQAASPPTSMPRSPARARASV